VSFAIKKQHLVARVKRSRTQDQDRRFKYFSTLFPGFRFAAGYYSLFSYVRALCPIICFHLYRKAAPGLQKIRKTLLAPKSLAT
jgi:Zn-dependent oligopeptidase